MNTINARQVGFKKTLGDGGLGNFDSVQSFCEQKVCRQLPITEQKQVTVSGENYALIHSGMISGKLAIGTNTTAVDGGIACAKLATAVGQGATITAVDGEGNIWNSVNIIHSGTHNPILTNDGRTVFALMHCASTAVDGDAIGAGGSENTQLSFVYFDSAGVIQTTVISNTIQFDGARVEVLLNQPALIRVGGVSRIDIVGDVHYEQGFINTTSVVVTHNLGKYPTVVLLDSGTSQEFYGTVTHNNTNQCTVTWSGLASGTVYCN